MPVPRVVIVGRPNVGKSSIFNWLDGRRLAIVDDRAGVTRDRLTTLIEHNDRFFELIDTGGMGNIDCDNLTKEVEQQIEAGIDEADLILFVVDIRDGLTSLDEMVGERLRKIPKPVLLLVNKADHPSLDNQATEFHRLGRGWLIPISVLQNRNRELLFEEILDRIPDAPPDDGETNAPRMKLAIVGRRNVGKSTFVNSLAKAQRVIVSEVPGTTRDSVDVHFNLDGYKFVAIDTPGLRRNKSIRTDIDFYGLHRAQRSIRRADVNLLFLDSTETISKVDKQLAHYIEQQYKPCIFVVNKWDKVAGQVPTERWVRYLRENFPTMSYCPIAFITGQTGKNMKALLNHAQMLYKQTQMRVSTANINKLLKAASIQQQPPLFMNRRPKIYFGSQIAISPPTIIMMCNMPQGFPPSYRRYLLNVFREHLPFGEVPIKMYLQKRDSEGGMSRRRTTARTGDELENEIPESDFIDDAEMDSWDDEGEATELDFLGDDQSQPGQPQEGN
jgi:GTPase